MFSTPNVLHHRCYSLLQLLQSCFHFYSSPSVAAPPACTSFRCGKSSRQRWAERCNRVAVGARLWQSPAAARSPTHVAINFNRLRHPPAATGPADTVALRPYELRSAIALGWLGLRWQASRDTAFALTSRIDCSIVISRPKAPSPLPLCRRTPKIDCEPRENPNRNPVRVFGVFRGSPSAATTPLELKAATALW